MLTLVQDCLSIALSLCNVDTSTRLSLCSFLSHFVMLTLTQDCLSIALSHFVMLTLDIVLYLIFCSYPVHTVLSPAII